MNIQEVLTAKVTEAVQSIFKADLPGVEFQPTRKDFEGDITVVVFPMLRVVKGNPVQIGTQIGEYLTKEVAAVSGFNVVKGFLNLVIAESFYIAFFNSIVAKNQFGFATANSKEAVMVEYSSPNTNKPLHLGHIRNNLLGYSVAQILKAAGNKVYKTQIINDRGIHICKSMVAWQLFGNGETPESTGLKGDKLVGNYYVAFDKAYKKEVANLDFDQLYYESNTYLLGKDVVADGVEKGVFFKKEDGSVWIDLTEDGLDEKIVLRSDGTAVYMTQDIGTAIQRVKDYADVSGMVYTVGNEQDYHFKVLFLILKKLGFSWAKNLFHLSYGMVDLPSGKMKSREGTVVDADDLMEDMAQTAATISKELGKLEEYSEQEKELLYRTIGMGALKYYILKVDPKKRILFNPEESVDFQGNTGPFIQYTYARIQSILRKAEITGVEVSATVPTDLELHAKEKALLKQVQIFPDAVQLAAENYSPAVIANYTYDLVKDFNSFYQNVSILGEQNDTKKIFRVQLSKKVSQIIQDAFSLLGIQVPERM